ncbi:hypothetical protein D3C75_1047400 [compost metagenome]
MRNNNYVTVTFAKFAQDPCFCTVIYQHNAFSRSGAIVHMRSRRQWNLVTQLSDCCIAHHLQQFFHRFRSCCENSLHRAVVANPASQHACINLTDTYNAVFFKQIVYAVLCTPVTWRWLMTTYHKAVYKWTNRLKVITCNSVVTD